MADGVPHVHGDSGTKPADGTDFQDGEYPDPEEFDWFWTQVTNAVNDHKTTIEGFLSGNVTVAEAQNALALEGASLSGVRSHSHQTLTNLNADDHHSKTTSLSEIADADPFAILLNTLANVSGGTSNRVLITTDQDGIYYDNGASFELVADHPSNIGSGDLGFDPATQNELESYAVAESGDTMTGDLNMQASVDANNTGGRVVLPVGTDKYDT